MRIATYNINGTNARLPRLLEWLAEYKPDIACLQEIKIQTENFPVETLNAAGYHCLVHGQKGFNGVAILSREPATETQRGLPGDDLDDHSRYLEAEVAGVRVASIYLPNGNPQPGPKFDYKLAWFDRLAVHAATLLDRAQPVILAGDYNVVPHDDDIWSPIALAGDALMQPESRAAYRRLLWAGWTDAVRSIHPNGRIWTFWDYQAGAWHQDHGFRIDHLLLSPLAADRLVDAGVDKAVRGEEKASDHAPTWITLRS
ncbi:nuclease [Polymorphobacter glacialis]|uniref:Nuclease n=1 Tax=Sandarakinorhabdus glacialis TaxID=1614636 RepID=A0A917ED80_9SPHN|nr:exodeoxyribonuclease III [Polymorphobacter glacialis]GGE21020.1 nuclease [Polymorphobacter glacialis]